MIILKKTNICARNIKTNVHVCGKCRSNTRKPDVFQERTSILFLSQWGTTPHQHKKFNTFQDMIRKHQKKHQHVLFSRPWQTTPSVCPRFGKTWEKRIWILDVFQVFVWIDVWKTRCVNICFVFWNRSLENLQLPLLSGDFELRSGGLENLRFFRHRLPALLVCLCVSCVGWPQRKRIHSNINLIKEIIIIKMILKTQAPDFDNCFVDCSNFCEVFEP